MLLLLLSFTASGMAEQNQTWTASIVAQGLNEESVSRYEVFFGVGDKTERLDAPPPPPEYSVKMEFVEPEGSNSFSLDIRETGSEEYLWIIAVNPSGNIMPPEERQAIISWTGSDLGPGSFRLLDGYDGAGAVVVEDMKATTAHQVVGSGERYYTIVYNQD